MYPRKASSTLEKVVMPEARDFVSVGEMRATSKGIKFVFSPKLVRAIRGVVDSFSKEDKQLCLFSAATYIAVAVCSDGDGILEAHEDNLVEFVRRNMALLVCIAGHALKGTPQH